MEKDQEPVQPSAGGKTRGEIGQEFAQLQSEMKRVLAEPGAVQPPEDGPAAERDHDAAPASGAAMLASQFEILARQLRDQGNELIQAQQRSRVAIAQLAARIEALERRRRTPVWALIAMLVLVGIALTVAVLAEQGGADPLLRAAETEWLVIIDHVGALAGHAPAPQTQSTIPAPPTTSPTPSAPPAATEDQPTKASETAKTSEAPASQAMLPATPPAAAVPPVPQAAPQVPAAQIVPPQQPAATPSPAEPPVPAVAAATQETSQNALPPPGPSAPASHAPAPAVARTGIVLQALADSWVQVRNKQGGVLMERILHPGDSWTVPDQPGLTLSTGNAGGLVILVDGSPTPSLGPGGMVRRDVPLDAGLLRAGHFEPMPGATKG